MKAFKVKQTDRHLQPKSSLKAKALIEIRQALKQLRTGVYTF